LLLVAVVLAKDAHKDAKNNPRRPEFHSPEWFSEHHRSSSSVSSSDTWTGDKTHGDSIKHDPAVFGKNYENYDSWSSSDLREAQSNPFYVARTLQTQTKKYIKNRIHPGNWEDGGKHTEWKAYCEGPTAARCELFVCYATSIMVTSKQFSKHISHKAICPKPFQYPRMAATPAQIQANPLNREFKLINPWGFHRWMKGQYTKAKKLCHKTRHTTDDRCKAQVLCLTLEIFTETWPQLFNLYGCDSASLAARDPHSPKLKHIDYTDFKEFTRLDPAVHKFKYVNGRAQVPLHAWDVIDDPNELPSNSDHHRGWKDQAGVLRSSSSESSSSESSSSDSSDSHHRQGSRLHSD